MPLGNLSLSLGRGDYPYTVAEILDLEKVLWRLLLTMFVNLLSKDCGRNQWACFSAKQTNNLRKRYLILNNFHSFLVARVLLTAVIYLHAVPGVVNSHKKNTTTFYSIVLMAIVDAKCRFAWESVGYPEIPMTLSFFSPLKFGKKLHLVLLFLK